MAIEESKSVCRSELLRGLMEPRKEKRIMSSYIAPHSLSSSRGVVSGLVSKFEKKKTDRVPLAEMEDIEPVIVEQQKKKTRRMYFGGSSGKKFINDILSKKAENDENQYENKKGRSGTVAAEPVNMSFAYEAEPKFRLKRTLTDSTNNHSAWKFVAVLGGPLKKRLSEGAATIIGAALQRNEDNDDGKQKSTRRRIKSRSSCSIDASSVKATSSSPASFFSALIRLSTSSNSLNAEQSIITAPVAKTLQEPKKPHSKTTNVVLNHHPKSIPIDELSHKYSLRPLEPLTPDRPPVSPSTSHTESIDSNSPLTSRRRPITVSGGALMRSERRFMCNTIGRRNTMSRTMSLIPASSPLPPLYEEEACSTMATVDGNGETTKRKMKQYGGSHTTSTYQGKKDVAPDASPRRHLIGFLHRTSHLSLTSELSADASFYLIGHRRNLEESTMGSESDARVFSDDDDRGSTTTDFTSVSRQHEKMKKKKNRRNFRKPSRASSFSSITESSMSLDVITVTLNMDTVNFLGISIVGQTSTRGDNGIYVANIMKGGAVALDGRIEAGDMILQVNDISFENFTNDQAVDVLRDAVSRRGPIKLTVAKSFENGPQSCFTIPRNSREEPVRPIDTQAWIQHTNAMRGMPSIMEEAPTPIPGEWPQVRPQSSSTVTSNGSNGQNTVVGGSHIHLDIHTDKKKVVEIMAMPNSGLDIKNRTWLKLLIPMSFLGSDLVEWLLDHVEGLRERKDARKYASELLKLKYIAHVVDKISFAEQCYYVLGEECADFARFRNEDGGPKYQWAGVNGMPGAVLPGQPQQQLYGTKAMAPSMVSGYASMPVSPYPMPIKREDQRSQGSGSSGASARM
ncbi:unnamed protein product [Caenorhabditis bovis]|uniref:Uncharacterized protein n=1 Tax=Caenorhabditis bovis TaxID=2654633 RepID=A0A8S1ET61_9PELO|nr:unnamed protein product [Caenorhabditis bovis]